MNTLRECWEKLPRPARGAIIFAAGGATALAAVLGPRPQSMESLPADPWNATIPVGVTCTPFESQVSTNTTGDETRISCITPEGSLGEVGIMAALRPDYTDTHEYSGVVVIPANGRAHEFDCVGKIGKVTMQLVPTSQPSSEASVGNSSRIDGVACVHN